MPTRRHEELGKKMLLSSRVSLPAPLRTSAPQNLAIAQFFAASPLPSPSLPSILPRHGKKPPPLNGRKIVRVLVWLSILVTLYWLVQICTNRRPHSRAPTTALPFGDTSYEIVAAVELPNHATPLAVIDGWGRRRWTISIPERLPFPLPATEYTDICSQTEEIARHVAGNQRSGRSPGYYFSEPHYIDVKEAQAAHLIPPALEAVHGSKAMPHCERSLTYVLDSTEAGLGSTLLGLWLSYGLSQRERRAFFIDDTHFPYGNYSTLFTPIHSPSCSPPPKTERVPCPHEAKHLVVTAATFRWSFGNSFFQHYGLRGVFDMARDGFEALFKLRPDDAEYVSRRVADLKQHFNGSEDLLVGIHIRRGDRHPFEFAYQHAYLPPNIYMKAAHKLVANAHVTKFLLASDDPDVYGHAELPDTVRAQERISLASKRVLGGGHLGWEGGFFKDVFWSLGLPLHAQEQKRIGSPTPVREKQGAKPVYDAQELERDYRANPTKEALQLRELIGRAYLLDLAVLAQSDRIVCGVSSYACRILAVMMGWHRAFERGEWKNVDGQYGWRALDSSQPPFWP